MGQAAAAGPPPGTITREEHRALLQHHVAKLREASQAVELARAPFDAARENLTATVDEARADLGKKAYTRKRLLGFLEDMNSRLRNLLAEEQQRHQDRLDLGLPVHGEQLSLALSDANVPAEAKDELLWEAEGFLLGRQGKLNQIPEGCPPRFHQTVMKAAEAGQALTMKEVAEGMELRKKRSQPDAGAATVNLNAEPEAGTLAGDDAERKSIRKAKESLAAMTGEAGPVDGAKDGEAEVAPELAAAKASHLSVVGEVAAA
jgi:hypothetical protein